MKWTLPALLLATATSAFAVTVGDSLDKVLAEKGRPIGIMSGGPIQILMYKDSVIKVREGAVISVRLPSESAIAFANPSPTPAGDPARAATAPAPSAYDGAAVWESDLAPALAEAKSRKCHVLVLFTGSDWCTWWHKMDAEVYSRPEFAAYARDKFVLVQLDFPHHAAQPEDVKQKNTELLHRYHVTGFPNAIVVDQNAKPVGRIEGYRQGGPEGFIEALQPLE